MNSVPRQLFHSLILLLCLSSAVQLFAQESFSPVPRGFGDLRLGSSFTEIDRLLHEDPNFYYRGKPDLTMLRRPNERMIETDGMGFILRGYFSFYEGSLYSIVLDIDEKQLDHFALFTRLSEKYGDPDMLDPSKSLWRGDMSDLVLERGGLRVKYVDRSILEGIRRSGNIDRSFEEMSRERFLEQF